jgi:hypothetical protein
MLLTVPDALTNAIDAVLAIVALAIEPDCAIPAYRYNKKLKFQTNMLVEIIIN